jgi:hypothetical protein
MNVSLNVKLQSVYYDIKLIKHGALLNSKTGYVFGGNDAPGLEQIGTLRHGS